MATAMMLPWAAEAHLTWRATEIEVAATAGQQWLTVGFDFTNGERAPIRIVDLRTDCDCTSAEISRTEYQPGEHGRVVVTFHARDSTGLQRKRVFVTCSANPQEPVVLTLRATIPPAISIEPTVLLWDPVNPSAPRSFTVVLFGSAKITALRSDSPRVAVEIRPGDSEGTYQLIPTIADTGATGAATLTVEVEVNGCMLSKQATLVVR